MGELKVGAAWHGKRWTNAPSANQLVLFLGAWGYGGWWCVNLF